MVLGPQLELFVVRRRALQGEAARRAFASYQSKVRDGRVEPPQSFDGLLCRENAGQLEELRRWIDDPQQSAPSRALAASAYRAAVSKKEPKNPGCR
jgi:hypothetical protein